jgi:hypothetical protein
LDQKLQPTAVRLLRQTRPISQAGRQQKNKKLQVLHETLKLPWTLRNGLCALFLQGKNLDDKKTVGEGIMQDHGTGIELREQAMDELQQSTTMLKVAGKLLDQGNVEEATRLRDEARAHRNISVWLMAKANSLEQGLRRHLPGTYHLQHGSTAH